MSILMMLIERMDDDLIAGSTNLYETLEFLYYIEKSGYQGYLGFDIFPYRIHPLEHFSCVRNTFRSLSIAEKLRARCTSQGSRKWMQLKLMS